MDIALKQRLVGASVLIALAVVVLPMLLGGRPESDVQETQTIELPPQPSELDFQTRRYPIGETPSVPQNASEQAPSGAAAATLPQPQRSPEAPPRPETGAEAGRTSKEQTSEARWRTSNSNRAMSRTPCRMTPFPPSRELRDSEAPPSRQRRK